MVLLWTQFFHKYIRHWRKIRNRDFFFNHIRGACSKNLNEQVWNLSENWARIQKYMKTWIASFDRIVHLCCSCLYLGGERCSHGWCVYMPQMSSQHTPRYVLRSPRLWVKTTNEKYICVLIFIWWMLAGTSGLCEPSSLETNFISGHVQYGFDKKKIAWLVTTSSAISCSWTD